MTDPNPTPEERAAWACPCEVARDQCDDWCPPGPTWRCVACRCRPAVAQQIREAVEAERRRVLGLCDDAVIHHIDCNIFDLPEQPCDCWVRKLRAAIESGATEL